MMTTTPITRLRTSAHWLSKTPARLNARPIDTKTAAKPTMNRETPMTTRLIFRSVNAAAPNPVT